uniref:TonB-dependent receptor n=1 Tax=Acinetobacter baumannii TaxID=470 RepID=A0AA90HXR2_ACIBA|nr:TonB-dependent receptor [Acinetobacter baumannii]
MSGVYFNFVIGIVSQNIDSPTNPVRFSLRLLSGIQYSSSKYANKEGTAKVGGYSVFNIGAAYKTNFAGHDTTFRFNIDNLFNKKYWRDVGAFMGDDYLFLGNPRTAQFSTTFSF